jgi:hypothetical protein
MEIGNRDPSKRDPYINIGIYREAEALRNFMANSKNLYNLDPTIIIEQRSIIGDFERRWHIAEIFNKNNNNSWKIKAKAEWLA